MEYKKYSSIQPLEKSSKLQLACTSLRRRWSDTLYRPNGHYIAAGWRCADSGRPHIRHHRKGPSSWPLRSTADDSRCPANIGQKARQKRRCLQQFRAKDVKWPRKFHRPSRTSPRYFMMHPTPPTTIWVSNGGPLRDHKNRVLQTCPGQLLHTHTHIFKSGHNFRRQFYILGFKDMQRWQLYPGNK